MDDNLVRTSDVINALSGLDPQWKIWLNHPQPVYEDGDMVISLELCEIMTTAQETDEAVNFYSIDHDAPCDPQRAVKIIRQALVDFSITTHPFVQIRGGGKSLLPEGLNERLLYTGPAREPITLTDLTRTQLDARMDELRDGAEAYWSARADMCLAAVGEGFYVQVGFRPGMLLRDRIRLERSVRDFFADHPDFPDYPPSVHELRKMS